MRAYDAAPNELAVKPVDVPYAAAAGAACRR
jgi:hypothetical protein